MSARDDYARSVRVLLALLVGAALFALALCAAAVADTPFKWSEQPISIDGGTPILGVSCLAGSACVAVDSAGNALAATTPSEAAGWTSAAVGVEDPENKTPYPIDGVSCVSATFCAAVDLRADVISIDPAAKPLSATHAVITGTQVHGVSCASETLCVAVDSAGNVYTSTDPTAAPATWTRSNIDKNPHSGNFDNVIWGVSCASESLCVAVDSAGNVLTSTSPKAAVWTVRSIEGNSIYSVSCVSTSLCVAVDAAGNILTSTDPGAESPTWTISPHVDAHPLNAVSCVAPSTCVAVDSAGNAVTSTAAAAGAGAWTVTSVDSPRQLYGVSCASSSLCVAVDNAGNALVGAPAAPQKLSVTVAGTGSGVVTASALEQTTVDCTSFCEPTYPNGTVVTLTAAPTTGSVFAGWTGPCSGAGPCTVTLSESREVGATFSVKPSPPGAGGSSGPSGSGSATQVNPTVAGGIGNLPGEGIAIPLRCWARSGDCLTTTLQLVVVEQLRHHRVVAESAKRKSGLTHRNVVVGSATVTLGAGLSETVDVRLNATGKKLLAQFRALSALFEIVSKQSGQVVWKLNVSLFEHTKHKKHK